MFGSDVGVSLPGLCCAAYAASHTLYSQPHDLLKTQQFKPLSLEHTLPSHSGCVNAPAGDLSFKDLVQRVHGTVASALMHADVPQMQVIAELARRQQLLAFNAIPYQARALTCTVTSPCKDCTGPRANCYYCEILTHCHDANKSSDLKYHGISSTCVHICIDMCTQHWRQW